MSGTYVFAYSMHAVICHVLLFCIIQTIDIGFATNICALRVSYVGELGWELHIPTEVNFFIR